MKRDRQHSRTERMQRYLDGDEYLALREDKGRRARRRRKAFNLVRRQRLSTPYFLLYGRP